MRIFFGLNWLMYLFVINWFINDFIIKSLIMSLVIELEVWYFDLL